MSAEDLRERLASELRRRPILGAADEGPLLAEPLRLLAQSVRRAREAVATEIAALRGRLAEGIGGPPLSSEAPERPLPSASRRLAHAQAEGYPTIYGDASHGIVLEAAGTTRARLLLITAPAAIVARSIARLARHLRPGLPIVARAEGVAELADLRAEGVEMVVQPEFEAGLQMTRQALLRLGVSVDRIHQYTDAVRRELYAPLREEDAGFDRLDLFQEALHLLELTW
ncbi:MAG: NAD-binding protein, partial [Proteobacteria bacterium]|nr:NAD-binding protein [Pseudomonadota bacterium]